MPLSLARTLPAQNTYVSSGNIINLRTLDPLNISIMYKVNNVRPGTGPSGTPNNTINVEIYCHV